MNIFAYGISKQRTSAGMITTVNDIFTPSGVRQSTPQSVQIITTNPTFGGITGLFAQLNGSLLVTWNAATGPTSPIEYDVYIQLSTAVGLFSSSNRVVSAFGLSRYVFGLADGTLLVSGSTYYVGVRARDPLGNQSTSTASLNAVSVGVQPSRTLSPTDIPAVVAAIWDELQAGHTINGSFGAYLDAKQSTRATQSSVNLIPTNPLLANDSRLDNIDAAVSSRASQTTADAINTKLGTPAGSSVSADIAAVKTDTGTVTARLTAPRAANLDNLDATVSSRATQSSVSAIPTNPLLTGDSRLNYLDVAISTRADGSAFTPVRAAKLDNLDAAVSSRATQSSVSAIPTNPLLTSDVRVDHLDADVSSRASATDYTSARASKLDYLDIAVSSRSTQISVDAVQATVNSIQGQNMDEAIIIPSEIGLPDSGSVTYRIFFKHSLAGSPSNPNVGPNISIVTQDGSVTIVSSTLMTNQSTGIYYYDYVVNSTAFEGGIIVSVTHKDVISDPLSTVITSAFQTHSSEDIAQIAIDTNVLVSRLTSTRAANLDNLDVSVSSRATQSLVSAINVKIGTPATSLSADIAAVQGSANSIDTKVDVAVSTRASQSAFTGLDGKIGTPAGASVSADLVSIKASVDSKASQASVDSKASQASVDALPTAAANADAVWDENINDHATGTSAARTLKDAKIFSQIDL